MAHGFSAAKEMYPGQLRRGRAPRATIWCPPVASSVAIPRRSRSGRRRSPAGGRQRAPMARTRRKHGTAGGGHAGTATSARSSWCSAAVRWETVSTPGRPPAARAPCIPRSSDAAARPHIPPVSGRGRARERAAHTSAAPAPRPAQAILFPPPARVLQKADPPGDQALLDPAGPWRPASAGITLAAVHDDVAPGDPRCPLPTAGT